MRVRVEKGPWGYSPRGFDHEVAEVGAVVEVPDHVAASAIAAGDVIEWTAKMAAKAEAEAAREAAARAKAKAEAQAAKAEAEAQAAAERAKTEAEKAAALAAGGGETQP